MRSIENDCKERCRALSAELTERVTEVTALRDEVQKAKEAGQGALSRERAKAEAAKLALRAELEQSHEDALREAVELERLRGNERRNKAVAEAEARANEIQRAQELERVAEQTRSRAEAAAQNQQRMNEAALSSYAAELRSLRESLGAKKSSLLPGSAPAGGCVVAVPGSYVSAFAFGFRDTTALLMIGILICCAAARSALESTAPEAARFIAFGSGSLGGRFAIRFQWRSTQHQPARRGTPRKPQCCRPSCIEPDGLAKSTRWHCPCRWRNCRTSTCR